MDSHALFPDSKHISLSLKHGRPHHVLFGRSSFSVIPNDSAHGNYCMMTSTNPSGLLKYRSTPPASLWVENGNRSQANANTSQGSTKSIDLGEIGNPMKSGPGYSSMMSQNGGHLGWCLGMQEDEGVGAMKIKLGSNLLRSHENTTLGFPSHHVHGYDQSHVRHIGENVKNGLNISPQISSRLEFVSHSTEAMDAKSGTGLCFTSGFPFGYWNDEWSNMATHIKRELDGHNSILNGRPDNLEQETSHSLSLPKHSYEMIRDMVPCKARAKRGCATHPRSISERLRRSRISERMRKLQLLIPNTDKQTSTADMLDLAVEYVKNLQKQYKVLSDNRAECRCLALGDHSLMKSHNHS